MVPATITSVIHAVAWYGYSGRDHGPCDGWDGAGNPSPGATSTIMLPSGHPLDVGTLTHLFPSPTGQFLVPLTQLLEIVLVELL